MVWIEAGRAMCVWCLQVRLEYAHVPVRGAVPLPQRRAGVARGHLRRAPLPPHAFEPQPVQHPRRRSAAHQGASTELAADAELHLHDIFLCSALLFSLEHFASTTSSARASVLHLLLPSRAPPLVLPLSPLSLSSPPCLFESRIRTSELAHSPLPSPSMRPVPVSSSRSCNYRPVRSAFLLLLISARLSCRSNDRLVCSLIVLLSPASGCELLSARRYPLRAPPVRSPKPNLRDASAKERRSGAALTQFHAERMPVTRLLHSLFNERVVFGHHSRLSHLISQPFWHWLSGLIIIDSLVCWFIGGSGRLVVRYVRDPPDGGGPFAQSCGLWAAEQIRLPQQV